MAFRPADDLVDHEPTHTGAVVREDVLPALRISARSCARSRLAPKGGDRRFSKNTKQALLTLTVIAKMELSLILRYEHAMRASLALAAHREEIRRIVEANRGHNPRVFGSALHGTDTDESDLDILIDPLPRFTLFDMAKMALDIENLTKTRVDIRTSEDISPKYRPKVIAEAEPI